MRRVQEPETPIDHVQMDGLAVMKIVKHCHEECAGNLEVAQGALLGLVVDNRLEITNCFPFPKTYDESIDEEEYQLDMMRRLRRVNVDHYHVGWYQSSDVGSFLSGPLLESQYHYQTSIEESVVLIYDTQKTERGFLTLKAYRLTPQAIAMYKEGEFTPDAMRALKVSYENLLTEILIEIVEEGNLFNFIIRKRNLEKGLILNDNYLLLKKKVPLIIRNSPLPNILMCELEDMTPSSTNFLDLSTNTVLEGHLRSLMEHVDDLNQEAIKFNRYQHAVVRQTQDKHRYLQKKMQENSARASKGEPPLPEEDINKLFRPIMVPPRLMPMIMAGQIDAYSQHISLFCSQSLAKLYMMQSLQEK